MTTTIAVWLRRLAAWLDPVPPVPVDPVLAAAKAVVAHTATLERRGAYKAAVALVQLRQQFPGVAKSRLKWAIETAVQERG